MQESINGIRTTMSRINDDDTAKFVYSIERIFRFYDALRSAAAILVLEIEVKRNEIKREYTFSGHTIQ